MGLPLTSPMDEVDAPSVKACRDDAPDLCGWRMAQLEGPSSGAVADAADRCCRWCGAPCPPGRIYCTDRHRKTAWRARKLIVLEGLGDGPKRLAYADPPFPGLSRKYYRDEPSFGGEVDHARLLEGLKTYDGWALSTSRRALGDVLSLAARADARELYVCPWVKTHHHARARGPSNVHEYVIVCPARLRFPGVPDALIAADARQDGESLPGRKPIRFVLWLFQLLGALPNDTLDDLFPGTGIVSKCWSEFQRSAERLSPQVGTRLPVMTATEEGLPG